MNTIMILGAGIYQVPLIKKARELGYRVIVCSIKGDYPGFKIADSVYYVNTTDKEACLEVAKKENIIAVCTTGTDVALPTLGYIVDTLGLYGPSEQSAILSSNKRLMKEVFVSAGVNTAQYIKVENLQECCAAAAKIGFPCILKVVDSSGSRGIEIIRSVNDIQNAYNYVIKYTRQPYILVEKYLDGLEIGAQAIVYKGKLLFYMTHSDEIFMGGTGVPIGHSVPFSDKDDGKIVDAVKNEIEKAVKALGIDNSAVNADFMLVDKIPYVLEIGARCGATCLPELVSIYCGIDYYEAIIKTATGTLDPTCFDDIKTQNAATALLITSEEDGIYEGKGIYLSHPQLVEYSLDCSKGDKVSTFKLGPDRIGQLIVKGSSVPETRAIAYRLLEDAKKQIRKDMIVTKSSTTI